MEKPRICASVPTSTTRVATRVVGVILQEGDALSCRASSTLPTRSNQNTGSFLFRKLPVFLGLFKDNTVIYTFVLFFGMLLWYHSINERISIKFLQYQLGFHVLLSCECNLPFSAIWLLCCHLDEHR